MNLLSIMRVALCAALVALVVAGFVFFPTQPVAGQETRRGALYGVAALDQLKQDGQYEFFQAAMREARFGVSRAEATPLGRAARLAPNRSAGYAATPEPVVSGAQYVEQQQLTANDGAAEDRFGEAIALDGDTLVVGAYGDDVGANISQGSVYVFTRSGGVWTHQQKITANDGAAGDFFGESVSVFGNTLAVGSRVGSNTAVGVVYVFTRSGATQPVWTQQQKITANDGAVGDDFGYSVSLSDWTLVVGAPGDNINGNNLQGSAYVFTRIGTVWSLQKKLFAADGSAQSSFGASVSLNNDTVAVGAYKDDIGANGNQGSVYIYKRYGTIWLAEQKLLAFDGANGDLFGVAVALGSDTLVVGAKSDDIGANSTQGSAYVYVNNGAWTLQQKLTASDGAKDEAFGTAVALSGDTLAVSAYLTDNGTFFDLGSVYVFKRSGAVWTEEKKITGGDSADVDEFGKAIALDDDTVMVAASWDDINGTSNQGSVYVFVNLPCPVLTFAPASLPDGPSGAFYYQQITVSGGAGPYQFGLAGGALPPGLILKTNGSLEGFLPAPGTYDFTISVTDSSSGCSGAQDYSITVGQPCPSITIDPPVLPNSAVGAVYQQQLTASGSAGPYTFDSSGTLPPGLTLTPNGLLSGAPTTPGSYLFKIRATDVNTQCYVIRKYTVTIDAQTCPSITIDPPVLPNSAVGAVYQHQLTASGSVGPYTFVSSGALPPGLTLTPNGLLSGMPTTPGSYLFKIRANDVNTQCYVIRKYTMTIAASCRPITIDSPPLPTGATGMPYSETLTASGGVEPYKFVVKGKLPPGLSLSPDGVLSGVPTQAGYFPFILIVSDARGCSGSRADSITITNDPIEIGVKPRPKQGSR